MSYQNGELVIGLEFIGWDRKDNTTDLFLFKEKAFQKLLVKNKNLVKSKQQMINLSLALGTSVSSLISETDVSII